MTDSVKLLLSVNEVLEHVKCVEKDVSCLSKEIMLKIGGFLEEKKVELTPEVIEALQLQDIISQQLSATITAIESAQTYIRLHAKAFEEDSKMVGENLSKLVEKLDCSLLEAKNKMDSFRGKKDGAEDQVEFF